MDRVRQYTNYPVARIWESDQPIRISFPGEDLNLTCAVCLAGCRHFHMVRTKPRKPALSIPVV